MRVRHYAQGKFYTIECPEGTRVVRRTEQPADGVAVLEDHLVVPLNGQEVRIPTDPPELLPMLAKTGNFGVRLVGEPVPEERLAGVACPRCGESDVTWLQPGDTSETVHCDYCGADLPQPSRCSFGNETCSTLPLLSFLI
jgi:ribosomal protein S27E